MFMSMLLLAAVVVLAFGASVVMARAANHSAFWNMGLAGVLALAVLAAALVIALLITRSAYPE